MADNDGIVTFTVITGIIALFLLRPKSIFGEPAVEGEPKPDPGDVQLTSNILPILAIL